MAKQAKAPKASSRTTSRPPARAPRAAGGASKATRRTAAAPVQDVTLRTALKTLGGIADGLKDAHTNLEQALFHLPRPSEYEPLVEPLRDFSLRAPALLESLALMPRLASALERAVDRLDEKPAESGAHGVPSQPSVLAQPAAPAGLLALRLERILRAVERARDSIRLALASLPTADEYAPAARQLKELASVSPSLMAWLREVPKVTTPLADSVDALRAAAESLDEAFVDVEITRRDLA